MDPLLVKEVDQDVGWRHALYDGVFAAQSKLENDECPEKAGAPARPAV
jgi:hypothetical protein